MGRTTISRYQGGKSPRGEHLLTLMSELISLRERVAQAELRYRFRRPGSIAHPPKEAERTDDQTKAKAH
jgi:hypothetical protein